MHCSLRKHAKTEHHRNKDEQIVGDTTKGAIKDANENYDSFIELLPECLLLYIFSYLDYRSLCRSAEVCKLWHRVSHDQSLKKIIDIRDVSITVSRLWKLVRARCTSSLVDLRIKGFKNLLMAGKPKWKTPSLTPKLLNELSVRSPHLTHLTVEEVFLARDTQDMGVTIRDFPKTLKHLSLRNSFFHPDRMFFMNSEDRLPHLVCLDLGHCALLSSHDLRIFESWSSIRSLYLEGCFRVNSGGIDHLGAILKNLQVLDIEGTAVSDDGIHQILQECETLKEFYTGHTEITDKCITGAVYHAKRLEKFCVCSCPDLSDIFFAHVMEHLSGLKWLSVYDTKISIEQLNKIRTRLPQCHIKVTACDRQVHCNHYHHHSCNI